jgi:metallo-beta-lactamase class B
MMGIILIRLEALRFMKLLPHFYQVAGPGLSHSYDATAYLISGRQGLYLIDCGTPQGYSRIVENIRTLGFDPRDIKAIFGTHGHYDHVGSAALFLRDHHVPLHLHREDAGQVESGDSIKTTAGLLYGSVFPPCQVAAKVEAGIVVNDPHFTLEAMHTPGHTPGGVCYILKSAEITTLIAGDTLHGGFSLQVGSDEKAWRQSLDHLCARHYDNYVFGHCPPMLLGDADTRLDCLKRSFGIYYTPWFKVFDQTYRY